MTTSFHFFNSLFRLSSGAAHVSVVVRQASDGGVDPKLYIFTLDRDIFRYFNFASGRNDGDDGSQVPPNSANSRLSVVASSAVEAGESSSSSAAPAVSNRYVVNHSWDNVESNFLVCHTKSKGT